jgi:hypothetical protein
MSFPDALVNVAAIRSLTVAQTTAYAAGYALENDGPAAARQVAIGRVVGCTVDIIDSNPWGRG